MIVFSVRDRLYADYSPTKKPRFVQVTKKGTKFDLGGEIVELFRIKVLADALDRTVLVLKDWERKGQLPRPLYSIEGNQCTHWYSAAQIINCHRLMYGRYRGRKYLPTEELSRFFADIKRIWTARDIVVTDNGDINMEQAHGREERDEGERRDGRRERAAS